MATEAEPPTKRIKTNDYHFYIGEYEYSSDFEDNQYGQKHATAVVEQVPCLSTSILNSVIETGDGTQEGDTVCFGMVLPLHILLSTFIASNK